MKLATVSGLQSFHEPTTSATGAASCRLGTKKWRIFGKFADAFSSAALFEPPTFHSMLDWPLQIQTSPTSTSRTVMEFRPATTSSCGPPAFKGSSLSDHFPSGPALAVFFWPAIETPISSPGSTLPQMGQAKSLWSTMPSPKSAWSLSSARGSRAVPSEERTRINAAAKVLIV